MKILKTTCRYRPVEEEKSEPVNHTMDVISLFEKFREVKHPKSLIVQQLSVEFVDWVREQQKR